jgi:hypothetical protein
MTSLLPSPKSQPRQLLGAVAEAAMQVPPAQQQHSIPRGCSPVVLASRLRTASVRERIRALEAASSKDSAAGADSDGETFLNISLEHPRIGASREHTVA